MPVIVCTPKSLPADKQEAAARRAVEINPSNHLHTHVVPRRKGDGLRGFLWPRTKYESDAERESYAARIAAALR